MNDSAAITDADGRKPRIEDYALIGDCESAALVGRDGSIDWLCWPRFDSDALFAALLGDSGNGCFRIAPGEDGATIARNYRSDALVLETRYETASGEVCVIDFMPRRHHAPACIRLVRGKRGTVPMVMEFVVRFGYGSIVPWVSRIDKTTIRAVAGPDMVTLYTPAPMRGENLRTRAEFEVHDGETIPFVLMYAPSHLPPPDPLDPEAALRETESGWRKWLHGGRNGRRDDDVIARSLITLKALTYAPSGGIVAAPTTSLPEQLGGQRNWDYRFCWLRDSTLTLLALMNEGFFNEAAAWSQWLLRAVAGSPKQMQIMYGISGERRLTEWEIPWLSGFHDSKPVRVGNAAHAQLQLDVFGEIMDTLHQGRRGGLPGSAKGWDIQRELIQHLEELWPMPDSGIWESRGPPRHYTYSKAMCWVAFDRAIKSAENFQLDGPVERWRALRGRIHDDIWAHGFDPDLNTFVRAYGDKDLDASLLLLASIGFVEPDDPRFVGTVEAVERELLRNGLVYRYNTATGNDGLHPGEGAFLACSFWLADAYMQIGRAADAEAMFERLCALCNDVGLLSEEYDPQRKCFTGNFPQAFSHIALLNTAANLRREQKPSRQRPDKPGDTPGRAENGSAAGQIRRGQRTD